MRLRLSLVGGAEPSEYIFGTEGGLFGRSLKCHWVLADEDRILSAIHGRIQFDGNRFMLVDESTNGIFLDGRQEPLGRGNSIVLQTGMRFRAARHLIQTDILSGRDSQPARPPEQSAMGAFPPSAPLPQPLHGGQPSVGAEQALRQRGAMGDLWGSSSQDPLAYLGAPGDVAPQRSPAVAPAVMPSVPQPAWPVAEQTHAPVPPPMAPAAFGQGPQPGAPLIPRDFFPAQHQQPVATAGYPQQPAQQAFAQPQFQQPAAPQAPKKLIPDDFDPLSVLGGAARRGQARQADPWTVAPGAQPAPPPFPTPQGGLYPSAPAPQPTREQLSPSLMADVARIGEPTAASAQPAPPGAFDAVEAMKARREERKARLLEKAGGGPVLAPVATAPSTALSLPPMPNPGSPMPQAAHAPRPAGYPPLPVAPPMPPGSLIPAGAAGPDYSAGPDRDAVAALFAGMGFPDAKIPPEQHVAVMREMGEMVRALSDGLVLLLSARRMVKTEFRMDETQVQPEENNPFKHFKIAELALDELFLTRSGGFQAPAEAASSAFEDVKQHVMLTMSAMQRAVRLLMERLGPDNAARENEDDGALRIRGLGARKGKWETYVETHGRMSGNLDAVTRQIIAEAFAQVQEEQARRVASQYWESKK